MFSPRSKPSIAAYHLAFGDEGFLYVTGPTTSSYDCIYRISKSGEVETFFRGLGRPQGMAFDREGCMYVAASQGGRKGIFRISPQGQADLAISGAGLLGLAFTRGAAAILASNRSMYHLNWSVPRKVSAGIRQVASPAVEVNGNQEEGRTAPKERRRFFVSPISFLLRFLLALFLSGDSIRTCFLFLSQ